MKKSFSFLAGMLAGFALTAFASCSFGTAEVSSNSSSNAGDKAAIVVNNVEDGYVTITMNALNGFIKDARTLMPDSPQLYFSVTGSTSYSDTGLVAGDFDSADEADCTAARAVTNGDVVIDSYYASDVNKTSGITLTLKIGKTYYLTAYGTSSSPADLSKANLDNNDFTKSSLYGYSADGTAFSSYSPAYDTVLGLTGPTNEEAYNKVRELLTGYLSEDAVVKGTLKIFVTTDDDGNVKFYKDDTKAEEISSISINTYSRGITGVGQPVIVIDLPATSSTTDGTAAYTLAQSKRSIHWVYVKWTKKTTGNSGFFFYDVSNKMANGEIIELKPFVAVGEYDLDISFLDETKVNDVFTIHDTLVVWKNQKSKILGTSSFYSATPLTAVSAANGSADDETKALAGDKTWNGSKNSNEGTDGQDLAGADDVYSTGTNACLGYQFTAQDVVDFQRTTFYVSGSGNILPEATGTPDGSLYNPFATVQAAIDAIVIQRAAGYDTGKTDWQIVLDGAEDIATEVSFTNNAATYTGATIPDYIGATAADNSGKDMNLTIRAFAPNVARAALSEDFTFVNANLSSTVNLFLTNFDWDGTDKSMTLGADVFLNNTALASDIANPAAGNGIVYLNVEKADTTANGTLYLNAGDGTASDTTSTVMNIFVKDENTISSGGYGHNVLSYKYHAVNEDVAVTPATFMTVDPSSRFAVSNNGTDAVVTPEASDYYNSDARQNEGLKKILKVDTEVGSETYGCMIVQLKDIAVKASFASAAYRGTIAVSPVTFTQQDVIDGNGVITGTITVISEQPETYPADAEAVVNNLKKFKPVNTLASEGSLKLFFGESEDENSQNLVAETADTDITANRSNLAVATFPTAAATTADEDGDGFNEKATYTFTITLNALLVGYANPATYYLRPYFELGEDDAVLPFSSTFAIKVD